MDVRLSPEQLQLRNSVVQVADRLGPATVGQLDDHERAEKLEAAVARSGWRELRTPDDGGGPLASAVEVAIVAEQLARGRCDVAFVGPTLAADLRRLAGAPDATTPETVALLPDLSAPATEVDTSVAVDAFGGATALVLVRCATDPSSADPSSADPSTACSPTRVWDLQTVAVPGRGSGVDLTRPTAPLSTLSPTALRGQSKPITEEGLTRWTALGLVIACADLVGTMQGAIDLTVGYAKQRRQFGKAIGSFQAVQHLLADAVVHLEGSRSATLYAAWGVDELEPVCALRHAAAAKAYAARGAQIVCETAIQVHGGIGNTWDCLAHLYLRRALLSTALLGGIGVSLNRVLAHADLFPEVDGIDPKKVGSSSQKYRIFPEKHGICPDKPEIFAESADSDGLR
ncbi:MAG TPA: acyl-CoA dehydrogenase family protein [Acidimicrobiales bacterium]|nr:acyl-CoA dehydrogenase family protein [Acidimicrobiales bacterium]